MNERICPEVPRHLNFRATRVAGQLTSDFGCEQLDLSDLASIVRPVLGQGCDDEFPVRRPA